MKTTKSFFEYEPPVRRQSGLITRALLILPPAFLLSLKYDLPHILILTSLMVVFPIFQDRSFRLRDRPVIYSLLAAGILAVCKAFTAFMGIGYSAHPVQVEL